MSANNNGTVLPTVPLHMDPSQLRTWLNLIASALNKVTAVQSVATETWTTTARGARTEFYVVENGTVVSLLAFAADNDGGLIVPDSVTGGSKGAGTINVSGGYYVAGTLVIDDAATPHLPSYTVATLPAATSPGMMIYVSDETGGAVPCFSDGTDWRRVTDRAVAS